VTLAGEDDSFVLPDLETYLDQKLSFVRPPDDLMASISDARTARSESTETAQETGSEQ